MSESQPKAYLPFFSAVCSTALESVFCSSTSAPPSISDCAPSVSLGGLNHSLTHTTLTLIFGFTLCAPSVKLSMLRMTSGIGIEPTTPMRVGLGHAAGDDAGHVRAFVGAAVVGAHVVGRLVAGGVLELARPGCRRRPSASAPCSRSWCRRSACCPARPCRGRRARRRPTRARSRRRWSATLPPSSFSSALRPLSCAKVQPPSPTGPR